MAKKKASVKKSGGLCTVESYRKKILTFLGTYDKKLMPLSELETKCRTRDVITS